MRADYFRVAYGVSRFELRLMRRNKTAFADPLISLVGRRNCIAPVKAALRAWTEDEDIGV